MTDEELERGLETRRRMFGAELTAEHYDGATAFTRPLQEMVSGHCFGDIWARAGLTHRERSMLTVAMCVAMGRPHEVRIHIQGAIANGVTVEEIRELLLHAAVYCGIPAAVDGFRGATEVFAKLGIDEG